MLTYTRNTLLGLAGVSLVALAAMPAQADGWRQHRYHGPRTVNVVKEVIYVQPRVIRPHRYWDRRWHRNWHRRPARVVYNNTFMTPAPYYRGSNAAAGTVIGAVLGGLTGSALTHGRGQVPAIVAGGLIGAIVGGSIGDSMDKVDRIRTQQAMETARTGQNVTWTNPDTGAEYSVTPTRTYRRENGQYCRDYKSWGWIDGYEEELHGTVCRADDGTWRKVS